MVIYLGMKMEINFFEGKYGEDSIRGVRIWHRAKYLTVPLKPLKPLFEKWWMSMISTRISVRLKP
jgi:hypothetical protein